MQTNTKYLGINGYKGNGEPFMSMGAGGFGIESTDEACRIALEANLHEYWLTPRRDGGSNGHKGYIRDESNRRGYRSVPTREAVLIRLIQPGPYRLADLQA
jgi:hypothetical protein